LGTSAAVLQRPQADISRTRELIEQAAAYSGAEDEERNADRIAQQEQELAKLIELREALLRK
jgi:hypothetical protein